MEQKISKASKVLGIISICSGVFIPIVGVTLSIIGLSIKKENYNRDVALNTVGLILSMFMWVIHAAFIY